MEYNLTSPLPVDECLNRLEASAEKHSILGQLVMKHASDTYPSSGKPEIIFSGNKFRLFIKLKRKTGLVNSFHTFFYGELSSSKNGTIIKGKFKSHPIARATIVFWHSCGIVALVFFIILLLIQLFGSGDTSTEMNGGSLVAGVTSASLFIVLGYGMVEFGKSFSKNEEAHLVRFLKDTLSAKDTQD
jgi:hypothetical protein